MKCGRDMDKVRHEPDFDDFDGFIPSASADEGRLSSTLSSRKEEDKGPVEDFTAYVPQPSELQQEEYALEPDVDEDSEIQQEGITTDFTEKQVFCDRCGVRNPHDQRYCKHCGSPMGEGDKDPTDYSVSTMSAPSEQAPVELATLSDMTLSSSADVYGSDVPAKARRVRGRRPVKTSKGFVAHLTAGRLIAAIVVLLVLAGVLWLFAFGGLKAFSSSVRNINKAGGVMTHLPSFNYAVTVSIDDQTAASTGTGEIRYEQVNKSMWTLAAGLPGKAPTTNQLVYTDNKGFLNTGAGWQTTTQKIEVGMLWSGVTNAENLGLDALGPYSCYHYRYNANPLPYTAMLGDLNPAGVSDAVVEVWIDNSTFLIRKITAKLYNAKVQGAGANTTFDMGLASTSHPFNIAPPQ